MVSLRQQRCVRLPGQVLKRCVGRSLFEPLRMSLSYRWPLDISPLPLLLPAGS